MHGLLSAGRGKINVVDWLTLACWGSSFSTQTKGGFSKMVGLVINVLRLDQDADFQMHISFQMVYFA